MLATTRTAGGGHRSATESGGRWRVISRCWRIGSSLAAVSLTLGLSGCAWILGLDDGEAEADRLASAVAELPGVADVEMSGGGEGIGSAYALVYVQMSANAGPAELERVLLAWDAAGSNFPSGDETDGIRRVLEVTYQTDDCVSAVTHGASREQLRDTAAFLPVLCAAAKGGRVSVEDDWAGRSVRVVDPELPLDAAELRALPGASTDHDVWRIDGTEYRWTEDEE